MSGTKFFFFFFLICAVRRLLLFFFHSRSVLLMLLNASSFILYSLPPQFLSLTALCCARPAWRAILPMRNVAGAMPEVFTPSALLPPAPPSLA